MTGSDSHGWHKVVVKERRWEATDVWSFVLVSPDGSDLAAWEPGAHIDVKIGPDLVRQYSLSGDSTDSSQWQVTVLRATESRGGSTGLIDWVQVGHELEVRGPRNNFALVQSDDYLFIAGGIGVTPILTMIEEIERQGRTWRLVYGGRSIESMAFGAELCSRHGDRVTLVPQDTEGLLDLDSLLGVPAPETKVYCCGPEPLLEAVEQRCARWPDGSLHLERFAPRESDEEPSTSFEIEIASTGERLIVNEEETVADVLIANGVDLLFSCEDGVCGTCETRVLAGIADHRDSILSPQERAANDVMFVCVSRSKTPLLVLDV